MRDRIKNICNNKDFQKEIIDFLIEMCEVDTTPNAKVSVMAKNEKKVFDIIKNKLEKFSFDNSKIIEKKISPAIANHPAFAKLYFTKTDSKPEGLPASDVYKNRYNLLYYVDGESSDRGQNTAVNAHIDIVAPFFPPQKRGDYVYGRGSIDDKGNVAAIYGALSIINNLVLQEDVSLKNKLTAMFVVEEETGNNGSLALAIDRELKKRYDSVLILECAGNKIYPAARGAVWFKCEAKLNTGCLRKLNYKPSLLESMIFSVLEMQAEGEKIKSESKHPLFPHKPVQTCNGILGSFGEHPSRICGEISFVINGISGDECFKVEKAVDAGINEYIEKYGDKTKVIDSTTGKKKVDHHYDIQYKGRDRIAVNVYGSTGHMGSILENDDAIVKWAYISKKIFELKLNEELNFEMELKKFDSSKRLLLEGGQGFLPTHKIQDVQDRMSFAFSRGIKKYLKQVDIGEKLITCSITYGKLRNDAYVCDPESPAMKRAWKAGIDAGIIDKKTPMKGFDSSCDARVFALEYPQMPVIICGAGELKYAHSDNENIYLPDLFKAIAFTALFLLRETGSI